MLKKLFMTFGLTASLLAMHEFELNLNDHDLDTHLDLDMGQFNAAVEPDSVFFGFRYLYGSEENNDKKIDNDHYLLDGHFRVQQRLAKVPALTLGMGMKLVYTSIEDEDFYALPLGILLRYELPFDIGIPFYVGGHFYYSPQVLSFQDAKNYMEYQLNLDIMIIERAGITAGYRKIDTNFDISDGDATFNESWFAGIKFRF
jgi:hypothetical protein